MRPTLLRCAGFAVLLCLLLSGCEDPPVTQAELDAMSLLQSIGAQVKSDELGHPIKLALDGKSFPAEALKPLGELPNLTYVTMKRSTLDDDGLAHFKNLVNVKQLGISYTPIEGPGLVHLQSMTSLEELDIEGTNVGDESLEHLGKIPKLRKVYISSKKKLSPQAIEAFKSAHPKVVVFTK